MKILYHHRIRSRDGQFVHVSEVIEALTKLGHEVVVVGPVIVDDASEDLGAGWVARFKKLAPAAIYELIEFSYSFLDLVRLVRAIRRHRPDFIYERYNLFFLSGVWARRLFDLPLLLEVNAPLAQERELYGGLAMRRFAFWAEGYTWRKADRIFPVTQVLGRMIEDRGASSGRIEVITNGVRADVFSSKGRGGKNGRGTRKRDMIDIGFVGYLRAWHRLDRVISLLARECEPRTHLIIVGDGPARQKLEVQAREDGVADKVEFVGVKNRGEIAGHVACFDIALQPSVVDYASPLKLQEYMAMGCAIVAPDKANIREVLVDGDNAILFDPDDDDSFEDAVKELCADADLRRRLGAQAVQTVRAKGLTWDRNAQRIIESAKRLLRKA